MKKRVLSGIRATGRLHLGNYFGMVKEMIKLQENPDLEVYFMVADLHAMTTPFEPKDLKQNIREVVLDYLACGLDPKKASLFVQSQVRAHIELSYLFSTEVTISRLFHLPTYKDKLKEGGTNTLALLYYPVLMASDILLYETEMLPVGDDQKPHLEIAREIARKFNEKYGMDFPQPKQLKTTNSYIPSLTGEGKMSKSVEGSFINLTDSLKEIEAKLAKVPTDSGKGGKRIKKTKRGPVTEYFEKDGEVSRGVGALLKLVELFEGSTAKREYEKLYQSEGIRYGDLKKHLAKAIYGELEPIQKKRKELEGDMDYVDKVIEDGAGKARKIAEETLLEVKKKMGLI